MCLSLVRASLMYPFCFWYLVSPSMGTSKFLIPSPVVVVVVDVDVAAGCLERSCCWHRSTVQNRR